MKIIKPLIIAALLGPFAGVNANNDCKPVQGRVTSELVTQFADGSMCPSPLGLCTEGRFTGRLKGKFRFVANTLTPFALADPSAPPDVASTTGVISIDTRYCDGTLVLDDTSAFSLAADGFVASLQTPNGDASTGGCFGASGRVRLEGVFQLGCVDCAYRGEICGVGPSFDDD